MLNDADRAMLADATASDVLHAYWVIDPMDLPDVADALGVDQAQLQEVLERYDLEAA